MTSVCGTMHHVVYELRVNVNFVFLSIIFLRALKCDYKLDRQRDRQKARYVSTGIAGNLLHDHLL